jgi:DNA-binding response OmpR family regulator
MHFVLVVEDHPAMAVAVAAMVRCRGFDSKVTHNGADALEFLRHHEVSFVVLDVSLPGISGLDVLRRLRSSSEYGDPPPVAMFSADEAAREESMRLGAVGFVCKTDSGVLLPLIEQHMKRDGEASM